MKYTLCIASALFVAARIATADPAQGRWQTEPADTGGYAIVEIDFCGKRLCGTIVDLKGGTGDRPDIIGLEMIKNMGSSGENTYAGGTIWAPDQDKTYKSKMELIDANTLKVSGCVLGSIICRGQTWTRVQ